MTERTKTRAWRAALGGSLLMLAAGAGAQGGPPPGNEPATPPAPNAAARLLDLQVHHMTISVSNLDKLTDWYVDVLGFSKPTNPMFAPRVEAKWKTGHVTTPGFQLDLIEYFGSTVPQRPTSALSQQGYAHLMFTIADPDAAIRHFDAAGAKYRAFRNADGKVTGMVVLDPDGNEIELAGRGRR